MQQGDYFVMSSLQQKIANARGKFSNQFMNGELKKENPSQKMDLEAGIRMGGYEVNIRRPVNILSDLQQPIARNSDFWVG